MKSAVLLFGLIWASAALAAVPAGDAATRVRSEVNTLYPQLEKLYIDLHSNPELSLQEEKTAAKLAEQLRKLGFTVTTGVGGHGVVGILRNGPGPTVMVRTDMDALPVLEQTGLPFASKVTAKDDAGNVVSVMHACGHDIHMASWVGTATILSQAKNLWSGTLMFIGQPAEERIMGAKAMLADGLFTRFPKPDVALGIHDHALSPAGTVGIVPGYLLASADAVDVIIYGKGGHGAYPQLAIDPVLIAAQTVVSLQRLVARENNPLDPAVVTVGSIHGGTKHNIIPDEVKLQLTVRAYKPEVRMRLLEGIERIAKAEAAAAQATQPPLIKVVESTGATYNDPDLAARVVPVLRAALGTDKVLQPAPELGSEDFSEFAVAGVPSVFIWVGAANPDKYQAWKAGGPVPPSVHSALFAPEREPTLRTAVLAETLAALELLRGK